MPVSDMLQHFCASRTGIGEPKADMICPCLLTCSSRSTSKVSAGLIKLPDNRSVRVLQDACSGQPFVGLHAKGALLTPDPEEPRRRARAASSRAFLSASPPLNCFFRRPNSSYLHSSPRRHHRQDLNSGLASIEEHGVDCI